MILKVYFGKKTDKFGRDNPFVIESNMAYAIPYWTNRKKYNKSNSNSISTLRRYH